MNSSEPASLNCPPPLDSDIATLYEEESFWWFSVAILLEIELIMYMSLTLRQNNGSRQKPHRVPILDPAIVLSYIMGARLCLEVQILREKN